MFRPGQFAIQKWYQSLCSNGGVHVQGSSGDISSEKATGPTTSTSAGAMQTTATPPTVTANTMSTGATSIPPSSTAVNSSPVPKSSPELSQTDRIAVGVLVPVVALCIAAGLVQLRTRRKHAQQGESRRVEPDSAPPSSIPYLPQKGELEDQERRIYELEADAKKYELEANTKWYELDGEHGRYEVAAEKDY